MKQRVQKIIAEAGICSRRAAENLIRAGRIGINGEIAEIGSCADRLTDEITADGIPITGGDRKTYLMLNKPKGYITTAIDDRGRKTVMELLSGVGCRVFPVGRLDMYSEGLLLMTNDGELANRIMHPSRNIKKTYLLRVTGTDINLSAAALRREMVIDGYKIKPADVLIHGVSRGKAELEVTVTEGKNRQIRKMCALTGLKLHTLRRVRAGPIELGDLPEGSWRYLTEAELTALKACTNGD